MAIDNFKIGNRRDDIKILITIIFSFLIVAWLLTPPGNKFLQVCFWGHNAQYLITSIVDKESIEEYRFYWKNAIYLTNFNDKKAISEMDKAILAIPKYFSEKQAEILYKERAKIKLWFKDYKGALDDYLRVNSLDKDDILRIAFLFNSQGKHSLAVSYCNRLLNIELGNEDAYACIADIYASAGKYNSSVKVFDYLINRGETKPEYYIIRSNYKKLAGDTLGESLDREKALELDSSIQLENIQVTNVMLPKNIKLAKIF